MARIHWKERFSISYKDIDPQHRHLLDILNELGDLHEQGDSQGRIAEVFHQLCGYALNHFAREEGYLAAAGYPDLKRHEAEHAFFVQKLLELNQHYESSDHHLVEATYGFIRDWYLKHIMVTDRDYLPFVKSYFDRAPIRALVVDLTGVVVRVDEPAFLRAAAPLFQQTPAGLSDLLHRHDRLFRAYEGGLMDTPDFLDRMRELAGPTFDRALFTQAHVTALTPDAGLVEQLREVKGIFQLTLLADTTPLRLEHLRETSDTLAVFDTLLVPFERRKLKTDPELLQDFLGETGLMSEECLYATADPVLSEAATERLFHGIFHATPETLGTRIRQLRLAH